MGRKQGGNDKNYKVVIYSYMIRVGWGEENAEEKQIKGDRTVGFSALLAQPVRPLQPKGGILNIANTC